jgi:hypothetical protein
MPIVHISVKKVFSECSCLSIGTLGKVNLYRVCDISLSTKYRALNKQYHRRKESVYTHSYNT